jgi:hypothetical protein
MSKFVAIIDDEKWVGCPLEHEGYCHIAWNKYYKCMEDCDGVLNDRPEFCPLKEYKEAIPIEWIVKWAWAFMDKNTEGYKMAMELLHDWEAENDKI